MIVRENGLFVKGGGGKDSGPKGQGTLFLCLSSTLRIAILVFYLPGACSRGFCDKILSLSSLPFCPEGRIPGFPLRKNQKISNPESYNLTLAVFFLWTRAIWGFQISGLYGLTLFNYFD
jgi:hypothetical protein